MSFSSDVKEELSRQLCAARHCRIAEIAAIISMCGSVSISKEEKYCLRVQTENLSVARKYFTLLQKTFNIDTEVSIKQNVYLKKAPTYLVLVKNHEDAMKILQAARLIGWNGEIRENLSLHDNLVIQKSCCKRAFIRGAFLASGSISNPQKSYHFEIACATEAKAVQLALVNLSVRAGYGDVTRLTLNMESRLAESFGSMMEWTKVEDVEICLSVEEDGKSVILCRKDGKMLKSVPSRLGKKPYVLEVKEAHKRLKDQYSRTRAMMEEAMESKTGFQVSEVIKLLKNPVVRPILAPLVYVQGEAMGFLDQEKNRLSLRAWDGGKALLAEEGELRIAHPLDMYRAGLWHQYQKALFDGGIRQPFKQVFRELYVKLSEELGQKYSRMFAGNQIQPKKTIGCLRGRRWVADYEEGLQKIYYKENIIARIYAIADWFSPSETEAPTLEWVEFSDRKTFQALTIEKVPDLIYSEVMRDVDLAVSTAYVGGVDPQASHSTVEMRRVIVEENLRLFRIKNVRLQGTHAVINGTLGQYTVHLGSGVIHQVGNAMLHVLPVHSQHRGKIFLPFLDEDPKTTEILTKILMFADDAKIKDPSVIRQICEMR